MTTVSVKATVTMAPRVISSRWHPHHYSAKGAHKTWRERKRHRALKSKNEKSSSLLLTDLKARRYERSKKLTKKTKRLLWHGL